jgi:hypothetical protein
MNHSELARWAKISVLSLFVACASTDKQTGAEIVPIIAVGTGRTPPEAREDALLRATEDAVGSYLFAETTLSNEELHEQIVNFRAGIIEHYVVLTSEQRPDGRWSIKVLADVNTEPITSLKGVSVPTTGEEVDGAGAVASALAKKRSRQLFLSEASKALAETLSGFPGEYLNVNQVGKMKILDTNSPRLAAVHLDYRIAMDQDRYNREFFPIMTRILDRIGSARPRIKVRGSGIDEVTGQTFTDGQLAGSLQQGTKERLGRGKFSQAFAPPGTHTVYVAEASSRSTTLSVHPYIIDARAAAGIFGFSSASHAGGGVGRPPQPGQVARGFGADEILRASTPQDGKTTLRLVGFSAESEEVFVINTDLQLGSHLTTWYLGESGTLITPFSARSVFKAEGHAGYVGGSRTWTEIWWRPGPVEIRVSFEASYADLEKVSRIEATVLPPGARLSKTQR